MLHAIWSQYERYRMTERYQDTDLLLSMQEDAVPIDAVGITNDFMFAYVMRDPDLCRELLEYLLLGKIEVDSRKCR